MSYGDVEDDPYDDFDNSNDGLEHWRWCEYLSVLEASMLVVGLSPSVYEPANPARLREGEFHRIGTSNHTKNYFHSREFPPVFRAIYYAILNDELDCDFAHRARNIPTISHGDMSFDECPEQNEDMISYDILIRSDAKVTSNFEISEWEGGRRFYFTKEPDWERSTIKVNDLMEWMQNRGRRPVFFFPNNLASGDAFRDPAHEHFSTELDLAVSAWEALLPKRKFPSGIKAAIEKWIEDNPKAWRGSEPLSGAAKERIATLINWNKGGGAPKAGG